MDLVMRSGYLSDQRHFVASTASASRNRARCRRPLATIRSTASQSWRGTGAGRTTSEPFITDNSTVSPRWHSSISDFGIQIACEFPMRTRFAPIVTDESLPEACLRSVRTPTCVSTLDVLPHGCPAQTEIRSGPERWCLRKCSNPCSNPDETHAVSCVRM